MRAAMPSHSSPTEPAQPRWKRHLAAIAALLLVLGAALGVLAWQTLLREVRQPASVHADPDTRFMYGSLGAEAQAGIPYWIFYVLPRLFPEKLPGPNGYASFGVSWEEGRELPIGFTKKTIGFDRVGNNCAVCHTASYRTTHDESPVFVPAGPAHRMNLEAFFHFLLDAANDPRFEPDIIMREIALVTELGLFERLAYRYLIIPMTKKALLARAPMFAWTYRHDFADWGPGRDDPMNLPKYFLLDVPMDDSSGPTDFPPIWNLGKIQPEKGHRLNLAGDSHDVWSVMIDSAIGLFGEAPDDPAALEEEARWLQAYLTAKRAPPYPLPIDQTLAARGATAFAEHCARCHASERTGTPIPLAEVGTDGGRLATWSSTNAIAANQAFNAMGLRRKGFVETPLVGYVAPFLDGVWLRGPFLHNGSVPGLADLLEPVAQRPPIFWRGYDVLHKERGGFISQGREAERAGTRYDTRLRGNGNQGHEFGIELPAQDKAALVEYLKTL